jgi:hypothetical protein
MCGAIDISDGRGRACDVQAPFPHSITPASRAMSQHMNPITIDQDRGAPPRFELDPVAWFKWAETRLANGEFEAVIAQPPARYEGPTGDHWRVVRTDGGIEIRPALPDGRVRGGHNPFVSAILIENRVVVELCSVEGRWTGVFDHDELEIGELGRAMIECRHLPHDNLRMLFGRTRR